MIAAVTPPAPFSKDLLRAENLVRNRGGRLVTNSVNLICRAGEIVGLLGPHGSGKTTCFEMIAGLMRPDAGRVIFEGGDVTSSPMEARARMGLGYIPQEPSVFRKMTVEENILAILEMLAMGKEERRSRCAELLAEFGLEHVVRQLALSLSESEKLRLSIARSLALKPSLLLLDEPFRELDSDSIANTQQVLSNLRDTGMGILISEYKVREALDFVDQAYVICEGKVVTQGPPDFLTRDPEDS